MPSVVPALAVGVGSGLVLYAVDAVAEAGEHLLWTDLPRAFGVPDGSGLWTFLVLVLTGVLVGLVLWLVPGHGGPDPATEGLVAPPEPVRVLPSLLLVTVLTLTGGVSLGPENPITAVNIALAAWLGSRLVRGSDAGFWLGLAAAGTIGALFGTPVAAALILSEMPLGRAGVPLWDRLFAPLIAAAAGALTTVQLGEPLAAIPMPAYPGFHALDVVTGSATAAAACGLGLLAVLAFPYAHAAFHRIGHPLLMVTAGAVLLGLLGALGGRITLFKGVTEMVELVETEGTRTAGGLLLVVVVKLAALVIAGTCGFRGGRIFPAVFTGAAFGLLAHHLVPSLPLPLAVTAAVAGLLVAVTRQGWLSLFTAAALSGDLALLPVLCVTILPAWLLATGRPEMQIRTPGPSPEPA
ncbi:ion channel protein [Actinomadura sp. PM05-2]|uniref:Ion channel protein n=1 Tax=Actinomadura parmotrematis TaxID=2864039 RepID=A0ABS7FW70_9ACTN|nr:ion channel protein [Actinomadura parmotrematis]